MYYFKNHYNYIGRRNQYGYYLCRISYVLNKTRKMKNILNHVRISVKIGKNPCVLFIVDLKISVSNRSTAR